MIPYLSIDLETTGLVPESHQILQVGAVWDDGGKFEDLKKVNFLISREENYQGQAYALQMNAHILKQLAFNSPDKGVIILDRIQAIHFFNEFVTKCAGDDRNKIYVAGKNAAGFDIPFLKWGGFCVERFMHRVIDPGSLYLPDFDHIPTMTELANHLDLGIVTHDALDDALLVVKTIRAKCSKVDTKKVA